MNDSEEPHSQLAAVTGRHLDRVAVEDVGVPRALELEYTTDGLAAKHVLARRANAASRLSAETNGDLARSSQWDEVMRPVGIGDLAAVACRDRAGTWGWVEAYRDRGDPAFDDTDVALLAAVGSRLGAALRRSSYAGVTGGVTTEPTGTLILGSDLQPVSRTESARRWLDALPGAPFLSRLGMLPSVIYGVAAVARHPAARDGGSRATLRTTDGRWVRVEAAALDGGAGQVAITLTAPSFTEVFDLLCRAWALTRRERDVVAALTRGLDTNGVAQRLCLSEYTVQDHLKSVFRKAGVHSRRELLAIVRGPEVTGSG